MTFRYREAAIALAACIASAPAWSADVSRQERARIVTECSALSAEFAHYLDFPDGKKLSEIFAPDGVWELPRRPPVVGRKAIEEFWNKAASAQKPGVKIRHLLTNMRIEVIDSARAKGTAMITIYVINPEDAESKKPLTPSSINVVADEYTVTDQGCFFQSRKPAPE